MGSSSADGQRPDPAQAADLAEFVDLLGELRVWAGNPSFRDLAKDAGHFLRGAAGPLPHATVAGLFKPGRRRLDLDLVVAIVRALGLDEPEVSRWREACVAVHVQARRGGASGVFRQLPPDLVFFTGRRDQLARLTQIIGQAGAGTAPVVCTIGGTAGVGKTRLAVRLAHQLVRKGCYGDLQLYVDLRGYDAGLGPASPAAVLDTFLRQLGVAACHIPPDLDARAAAFRDLMHGRHALMLLDNAASAEQVRPLLPAEPACLVLVTSRRCLTGLDGAFPLTLDPFSPAEAVELIGRIAGAGRVAAEPGAADRVTELCGYLPIAVTLAAQRLRVRPAWGISDLARQLTQARLGDVGTSGRSLRGVLALSYTALSADGKLVFRVLALHPGEDITPPAAAALAGIDLGRASSVLEELLDENLLYQHTAGRYRCHDLLLELARERCGLDDDQVAQRAALRRLLSWYVHTALAARQLIDPFAEPLPGVPAHLDAGPAFASPGDALDWCEAERPSLVAASLRAADLSLDPFAWLLPAALVPFFALRRYPSDYLQVIQSGLAAAQRLGDAQVIARMWHELGTAQEQGWQQHRAAAASFHQAQQVLEQVGPCLQQASTLRNLSVALKEGGEIAEAIEVGERAAKIFAAAGDSYGLARTLNNLAGAYSRDGNAAVAFKHLNRAMTLFREAGDMASYAMALGNLALAHERQHDHAQAIDVLEQARSQFRSCGDLASEALCLAELGRSTAATGNRVAARSWLKQARLLYHAQGDTGRAARIEALLRGEPEQEDAGHPLSRPCCAAPGERHIP